MLDGFFGSKWAIQKTDKQSLETRIKDSVLNMIIDRDQSFLKTARQNKTSIIVNNRDGGIQEFDHNGRKYISFPSSMEKEFEDLTEDECEEKMDSLIRLCTADSGASYEEGEEGLILDDHEARYESVTGMNTGFVEERDAKTKELMNNPFEYRAGKSEEDDEKDKEEGEDGKKGSCEVSSKGMDSGSNKTESKFTANEDPKAREYSFEDVDLNPDGELPQEVKDNRFFSEYSMGIDAHREAKLKALANQIVKSFQGRVSKQKTMIPSKKLVSKSLVMDISEKIYQNKRGDNGKNLNINLIIDMSGSMDGTPVMHAQEMIYIFNEIAIQGYLTGSVLWSESRNRCVVPFPMPREFVKRMKDTGGAEGLGRNLEHYKDILKKADTNICMTDGQLCEDPILKSIYAKEKIEIIGVYVNEDAKDLTEYTGSLDRWFTRSLVRNTLEELTEKLVQFSLRKKK